MQKIRLVLIGFGNVGQAFASLLAKKQSEIIRRYGMDISIVGVATKSHGCAYWPEGYDIQQIIKIKQEKKNLKGISSAPAPQNTSALIKIAQADVMCENTPVNYLNGQPAVDHCISALNRSMHVITANKGPVVHAFDRLKDLAAQKGIKFLFESAVMDGAPIFSLFRETLPIADLKGFCGILNSCTNLILELRRDGQSLEEAIAHAQSIGIAETDPSGDIDGWDAAIKVAALATVLMGIPTKPQDVERCGIRSINREDIVTAVEQGKRWKLICRAWKKGTALVASVKPQLVSPDSPFYSVSGTSSFIQFHTDVLPGIGILETNPEPATTAYGLLSDLLTIYKR